MTIYLWIFRTWAYRLGKFFRRVVHLLLMAPFERRSATAGSSPASTENGAPSHLCRRMTQASIATLHGRPVESCFTLISACFCSSCEVIQAGPRGSSPPPL